ncbi:ankyrin repeat-containing domain protein [Mycena rebaudengoi]|nr:ankyrin repeat-containing domain protein [Mycena rebaudengoi]
MDPVSAVGLVASILQLVAAAKSAIDLGRDAVNATKDQRDLLLEVQNLTPLLEDLKHRLQQPNNQSVNVFIQKLEKPLEQLKGTMEHIARKLGSANKVGSTALIWTFWNKTEVDADLAKIERFKTVLNAWLLLDTWDVGQQQEKNHSQIRQDQYRLLTEVKNLAQNEQDFHASAGLSLLEIRDMQQRSHDQISETLSSSSNTQRQDNYRILTEVRNAAQDQREVMDSAEREKIIDWLSPLNFFARHADIFGTRQEGTGRWLLEDPRFRTWLLSPGEIIWCSGIPGAGKTVLASIIVDYLRSHMQSDSVAVAAVYLNHKESGVQSPSNILAGLWWQLVSERPISASVQKLYQKHQKQCTRPSLDDVRDIVRSAVAEWSRVFIIVDALDEYPEAHRRILLDTLAAIGAVSLLLTSRPNIAPESFFPAALVLEICAREEDIRRYIDVHIQTSSRLSKHVRVRPELRAEIESKIIGDVDGMFLLAKLHMDSLAIKNTVKAVRDALKNLPEDLEHTYNEAMDRIESQNKDDREIARRALIWVANAKRPLSVHELCEALAIELGATTLDADGILDIEFIVSVCAGLLIVDQAVRLVHYTTQDYIDRVQPSRFPHAQMEITSQCLTYISFDDFRGHRSQDTWNLCRKHKLLSYTIHYCLVHAAGEPESLLQERIIDFLSDAHRWHQPLFLGGRVPPQWYEVKWPSVSSKLWVAAIFGLQEITKHLLEFDQSISKEEKESALLDASYWNCPGVIQLLVKHGANLHAAGGYYGNALQTAAAMDHVSVAQELIANGVNVNLQGGHYGTALQAASARGQTGVVRLLLKHDADVSLQGGCYGSVLQAASETGRAEVVQLLLDHGTDVNMQGERYGTALNAASAKGWAEVVQLLLEHGADMNMQGRYCGTALQAASRNGNDEIVQLLLEKGADVNTQGGHCGTALQAASAEGKAEVVQLLLENGADMNFQGGHYGSALHAASAKGKGEVVQLLLKHGADVNLQERYHGTALQAASAEGKAKVVQLLLKHNADVNLQGGHYGTALQAACATGRAEVVQLLLDHGTDVNVQGGLYGTALNAALANGRAEVVQLLLKHAADVNMQGGHYGAALQAASENGRAEVVQLLLDHAADVNMQGGHYGTALQAASENGRAEVVQLLLDHGADVNVQGERYGTALQAASVNGTAEVVQLLLEHGADVNLQGGHYGTALQAASVMGKEEVVQLLLDHGADVNLQGGEYGVALQAASAWGNISVVQLLLKHGADVNVRGGHHGSALQAALWKGKEEVVQLLLAHGASRIINAR